MAELTTSSSLNKTNTADYLEMYVTVYSTPLYRQFDAASGLDLINPTLNDG